MSDFGSFGERWRWVLEDDTTSVQLSNRDAEHDDYALNVPGVEQVLAVDAWPDVVAPPAVGEAGYLIVATVASDGRFGLWRFHDVDGDGGPDQTTLTLVLQQQSGQSAFVTHFDRSDDGTRTYFLDRRCQDILVGSDTSGDGLPDTLDPTPYARSEDDARLLQAAMVLVGKPGSVGVPLGEAYYARGDGVQASLHLPRLGVYDTGTDDRADAFEALPGGVREPFVPLEDAPPFEGQSVLGVTKEAGRTAEVWTLDVDGELVTLLGASAAGAGETATVALSASLSAGALIGLRYSDAEDWEVRRLPVREAWPEIVSLTTRVVALGGESLTVTGQNFSVDTSFHLVSGPDLLETPLSHSLIDSSTASVVIPALRPSDAGAAWLVVQDASQPTSEEGASGTVVSVCDIE